MVKNIVSYSHLKNECLFNSREEAISGLTSQPINDGVIKLARYYDENRNIKTIFGISYTYPNTEITTYTIYDNEQTKGDLTVTLSAYTPTESGSTIATRYTLYQGGKSLGNIDIYKDSFLESVELVYDEQGKAKWLRFTFILSDGTKKTVDIPLDSFIQDLEAGQGLYVGDDGSINVGKDETSEEFLEVKENSIAVVGVHSAINTAVDSERVRAISIETTLSGQIADIEVIGTHAIGVSKNETGRKSTISLKLANIDEDIEENPLTIKEDGLAFAKILDCGFYNSNN